MIRDFSPLRLNLPNLFGSERPFYIGKKWGHANGFVQIYNLQSLSEMTTVKKLSFILQIEKISDVLGK